MTVVVNLFGAPGSGKSTTAAGIFYNLKLKHTHCEMVREYVKSWSWEGRKPGDYDQMYILGKQIKYESLLYGKVDVLVTDSPIILSGFYEHFHGTGDMAAVAAAKFMTKAESNGIQYKNFWLSSHEHFDERGRHHSKEEVEDIGPQMREWLSKMGVQLNVVDSQLEDRVNYILNSI